MPPPLRKLQRGSGAVCLRKGSHRRLSKTLRAPPAKGDSSATGQLRCGKPAAAPAIGLQFVAASRFVRDAGRHRPIPSRKILSSCASEAPDLRPALRTELRGRSQSISEMHFAEARRMQMPYLSAWTDRAWQHLFTGWELLEHKARQAELARRHEREPCRISQRVRRGADDRRRRPGSD